MKLTYPQLTQHLTKTLAPVYLISGDELLLVQEAVEAIRAAARQAGFNERISITADAQNNWSPLFYTHIHNLSLFSSKKIIELNLSHSKFNATTGKILEDYTCKPLTDILLIISTTKLDAKIEKTAYYQRILKNSVVIPIWPIPVEQFPQWVIQRAQKNNVRLTLPAAQQLAALVEGNLLAAAQEIEKLSLLYPANQPLDPHAIESVVMENARFDIFHLVDSALLGNGSRCLQILKNLAAEGVEPTLILWALTRELRLLADMKKQIAQGIALTTLFSKARIWEKRQTGFRAFLKRHTHSHCWKLLTTAAKIDRMIKGIEAGHVWNTLEDFTLQIANLAS